jgi:hypothetical protein
VGWFFCCVEVQVIALLRRRGIWVWHQFSVVLPAACSAWILVVVGQGMCVWGGDAAGCCAVGAGSGGTCCWLHDARRV